jgi:cell division protein DivIC
MKRRKSRYKRSVILISGVLITLIIALGNLSLSLQEERDFLIQQEQDLLLQIEQQEQRSLEIIELEEFIGTPEHIRIVAKEELGLVDPDGIYFRAVD